MKGGTVVETGTHPALIENGGEYAKLYNVQAGAFLPDVTLEPHACEAVESSSRAVGHEP